ncbi:copper resistance protein CopC [Planococcus sp. ANT_H30]|uniref:Copper resistance protein CopC n=1 Tax=Planococcus kocurii TaxID=1374 RepID=A0ABM5WTW9_9BACL|nr:MULTISPECIES: copper resistance CopC family protein [Planococcus]ALS77698.1 copper resistance protein CopC [Planococcus kocurii]KAA0958919.1 copper resistance protein CopC [Planococcus sp. ANT_H30]
MYKKFFVFVFLLLLVPVSVQAHTTLLSSTPAEGENIMEALKEVQLVFGTKIEEGSTMTIEGESGSFEFDRIVVGDDSLVGTLNEALPNGSYRILWNIIGEDGHPIEGEITFGVSIEIEEEVTPAVVSEKTEEPEAKTTAASETVAETQTESDSNLLVTILLVLAAILVVYGIYKLLLKKK